jgi:hypothetical protein
LRVDDTDKAASSIKKGRAVKSIDHALWERELAEYLSLHPDLEELPPPVFPRRRTRLGRRLWFYRQARRARRARSRALRELRSDRPSVSHVLIISLVVLETLVLGAVAGWWMGWHL